MIPLVPPSFNEIGGRSHWRLTDEKKRWYDYVKEAVGRREQVRTPSTILFTIYCHNAEQRDNLNYAAGLDKLVCDAISKPRGRKSRGLGLIPDDASRYIPVAAIRILKGDPERTELSFYPVGGLTI